MGRFADGNVVHTDASPLAMVKDHRTEYEVGNDQAVLDGDLDGFTETYLKSRAGRKR